MRPIPNLVGNTYGRWTVISFDKNSEKGKARWLCECSCGDKTRKIVLHRTLVFGMSRSCGCLTRESNTKHGMYGSPTYGSWCAMKERLTRKEHPAYHRYGGRGITACDKLFDTFEGFLEVMGIRPEKKTLDRIKNDGHYHCGECSQCIANKWEKNVRWSTAKVQRDNSSGVRMFELLGETMCLSDWARRFGMPNSSLKLLLDRGVEIGRIADGLRSTRGLNLPPRASNKKNGSQAEIAFFGPPP